MKKNKLQIRLKEQNITIHKYMDYPKFLSLLTTNAIYFARPREFEDKLDCIFPDYTKIKNDSAIQNIIMSGCKKCAKQILFSISERLENTNKDIIKKEQYIIAFRDAISPLLIVKKFTKDGLRFYYHMNTIIDKLANLYIMDKKADVLNELTNFLHKELIMQNASTIKLNHNHALVTCWHIGEYESDLMWKIYAKKDGILIQTNAEKLKQLDFNKYLKDDDVLCIMDKVRYIDLVKRNEYLNNLTLDDIIDEDQDTTRHYFEKSKSFEAEKELRIVIAQSYRYRNDFYEKQNGELVEIKMPICDFIEKIVISPYAPDYYAETLYKILKNMKQNDINKLADKIELSNVKQIEKALL